MRKIILLALVGIVFAAFTVEANQPTTKPSRHRPTKAECKYGDDPIWQDRAVTELIVVHHSATSGGNVERFAEYHKGKPDKFNDIGYHFVITNGSGGPDGEVQEGRWESAVGAHDPKEKRNFRSVGVCLVGENVFTDKQKSALIDKLAGLCKKYKIKPSAETIVRHHDRCPGRGLDLDQIIAEVKKKIG
ncbi:peptidoglycan recognition protein family protein [Candidatus Parcubacteria bacterium]|nr:peptidoglycan recognition protein family protein [Candidatus Parcubacteria bacterium]